MKSFLVRLLLAEKFDFVLAVMAFIAFCWPMIVIENLSNPKFVVGYYFSTWAILILIQFLSSAIRKKHLHDGNRQ